MNEAPLIEKCRVCGNRSLQPCLSLGSQYLSSMFPETLDYRSKVPCLPLELVICEPTDGNKTCGLVQLAHDLDLSQMYEHYPYTSATNSAMPAILKDVADSGRRARALGAGDVVMDIGCNDGTLLRFFEGDPVDLVGIDPAKNVAFTLPPERCKHTRDYFSRDAYERLTSKKASLIFSIAMYYHLHDPVGFSQQVAGCLADDGVWIIQMAYLPAMLTTNMYDNIVHEHAGYYATIHMKWIMERVGLEIFDVELNDVYGGSFRVFVKKKGSPLHPPTGRYREVLRDEAAAGIYEVATYQAFAERIQKTRDDLNTLCARARAERKTIWVYGASTKGNTIVQYCGLGPDELVAAADANPFKLGKFIVGADIPIQDEAAMRAAKPDYLLALPYSFVDSFMKREQALIAAGTKFIVPLPDVKVLPA
jgi:NDP-4-keto-2,6-dideoxyhexose 3-C-methyltransferase